MNSRIGGGADVSDNDVGGDNDAAASIVKLFFINLLQTIMLVMTITISSILMAPVILVRTPVVLLVPQMILTTSLGTINRPYLI